MMFPTYLLWTAAVLSPAGAIIRRARLRPWLSGRRKIWPRLPRVEASSRRFSELLKAWHRRKSLCGNSLLDSKFDQRLEDKTPLGPSSGPPDRKTETVHILLRQRVDLQTMCAPNPPGVS